MTAAQRIAIAAQVVTMDAEQLAAYRADQFSAARLKPFADEAALLDMLKARNGRMPSFFTLTDAPIMYVLAAAKPPYQINGFSMSPIFEQTKMVDYLRSEKIEYVIVEPNRISMDGFSYFVRLPVLYNYVVANYIPDFSMQQFSVFRMRKSGEPISFNAWISILGTNVDLGYLPVYSEPPTSTQTYCGSDCDDMLKVSIRKIEQDQRVTIPFTANGKALGISFVAVPGKVEYWIKLNRIWFWDAWAGGVSLAPLAKSSSGDLSMQILHVKPCRAEHLY